MKTLSIALFLTIFLFAGCKKNRLVTLKNTTTKTYLLSRATYTTTFSAVDSYTYDSANRVIDFNSGRINEDYKYTYDSNNRLITTHAYKLNDPFSYYEKYNYSGNTITAQHYASDGKLIESFVYILDDQSVIVKTDYGGNFFYDAKGNLTTYDGDIEAEPQSDTITYDDQKHPLSMLGAKNFHLMTFASGYPQSFADNIVTTAFNHRHYTYKYNSDGFPVSASGSTSLGNFTVTYEYIFK